MQIGNETDIPKINSGLRYESHIIYEDQKAVRANKQPVKPAAAAQTVNRIPVVY
jgi:hypothetical protein